MRKEISHGEITLAENILRVTYNREAETRSMGKRNINFDVYKTKTGDSAKIAFQKLAVRLLRRKVKINPAVYVKVMSKYGKFESASFMPPPGWLAKRSTVSIFSEWLYKRRRNYYELESDWKASIASWSDKEILGAVEDSLLMVKQVMEGQSMPFAVAVHSLWPELTPWFRAAYVRLYDTDSHRAMKFLSKHRETAKKAARIISKNN